MAKMASGKPVNAVVIVDSTTGLPTGSASTPSVVTTVPATTGGLAVYRLISLGTTNANFAKAMPGQVYAIYVNNANAAIRYLKLYNKATSPVVGTDVPVLTLPIPATGFINPNFLSGIAFSAGIAFALTTGIADSDTGAVSANEHIVHIAYK